MIVVASCTVQIATLTKLKPDDPTKQLTFCEDLLIIELKEKILSQTGT